MGAEELKKRRRSHDKYIDRQRVALATPDLFTQTLEDQPRTCIASIVSNASIQIGDTYVFEAEEGHLLGRLGNAVHLDILNTPADILEAVRSGAGVAKGEVCRINKLSRTAEVTIK
jgi:hypothetical protein